MCQCGGGEGYSVCVNEGEERDTLCVSMLGWGGVLCVCRCWGGEGYSVCVDVGVGRDTLCVSMWGWGGVLCVCQCGGGEGYSVCVNVRAGRGSKASLAQHIWRLHNGRPHGRPIDARLLISRGVILHPTRRADAHCAHAYC